MQKKNLKACGARHELYDAKINVIEERMAGHWTLDDERWASHARNHDDLAASLRQYKQDSNEWRGSLSDLRGTYISKAEYQSEHRALRAEIASDMATLAGRVTPLETYVTTDSVKDKTVRSVLGDGKTIVLLIVAVVASIFGIIDFFRDQVFR